MLKEVIRPDKSSVSFQYDIFGRRIEKSVTGTSGIGALGKKQEKVT